MPDKPEARNALILLAEDDENDIQLFRRALAQADISNPVEIVRDGEQAVKYLKGEGKYSDRAKYPVPALVLLDLKMPRLNGFQVLDWIRRQPSLKALRVVVLTTSQDIRDVTEAYYLGANSFIVKSMDIQDFTQLIGQIRAYWLSTSLAPRIEMPHAEGDNRPTA